MTASAELVVGLAVQSSTQACVEGPLMGFAASPATKQALAPYGIRESGVRWKWAPGAQGQTFPPHREINGQFRTDAGDFEAEPGHDVNGSKCLCWLVPLYRTADGRIAKAGLKPLFLQPGESVANA